MLSQQKMKDKSPKSLHPSKRQSIDKLAQVQQFLTMETGIHAKEVSTANCRGRCLQRQAFL